MIIAVGGKKRSGKDTVANYILEKYDNFEKYSLASPMKEAMAIVFGWGNDHLYGSLKEVVDPRWGISPRQALQHFGTEWGQYALLESFPEFKKKTGRHLWINKFIQWYETCYRIVNVVIPDIRFYHEFEGLNRYVRRTGVSLYYIRVLRDIGQVNTDTHESERQIDSRFWDVTLLNDGTIEDLHNKIRIVMKGFNDLLNFKEMTF
jgi:hypothetical protein